MSDPLVPATLTKTLCLLCAPALLLLSTSPSRASNLDAARKPQPVMIDQSVIDAAMEKLLERQRQRASNPPATQPVAPAAGDVSDPSDEYGVEAITARKLRVLKAYDAQLASARAALRQRYISPDEVRRVCGERAAFQKLPLARCRELMIEVDRQNAQRLQRYQEAFGDLPMAAKTVSIILMKSGQIDFATPLPEDPLTREVEESRGVRRVYFQFYLNPPNGSPRRHNGYVEFIFAHDSGLWVPTWCDYNGEPMPLFDAEAFVPLRPYQIVYDGKQFVVAPSEPMQPPQVFALLTPRWGNNGLNGIAAPARW